MAAGLRGRRGLVTGAARGIGRRVAQRLADEGMRMTLLDVDPAVEQVAAKMGAAGVVADLRDEEATRRALASAAAGDFNAGSLDAAPVARPLDRGTRGRGDSDMAGSPDADPYWLLVNNAGVFAKTPLLEMDLGEWDDLHRVNARSMVVVMQALAPAMIASGRGGRVVNMASMAAKRGTPGEAAYAASKAAVVALSRIAAMELGPHGITVNSICPGYVLTEMGADTRSPDQVAAWTAMSPLGRLGDPTDVAAVVAFLASDDGAYITGQALNVTGGMCTW